VRPAPTKQMESFAGTPLFRRRKETARHTIERYQLLHKAGQSRDYIIVLGAQSFQETLIKGAVPPNNTFYGL